MKQTLVLDSGTFSATTAPINCAGCWVGLSVTVGDGNGDNHVTVYPEVTLNYLDWFPLTYAFIPDEGDLIPDGIQMTRNAVNLTVKAFKQLRIRVNGGNGVDTIPVAIEMVARS